MVYNFTAVNAQFLSKRKIVDFITSLG